MFQTEEKVIVQRVKTYGPKPRSAKEALIQAHAFLAEEGQWVAGKFFEDGDPKEAYEKSECSSWGACAMGALGLVTGESPVSVRREWDDEYIHDEDDDNYYFTVNEDYSRYDTPVSYAAATALVQAIDPADKTGFDELHDVLDIVFNLNDQHGRTKVLDAFAAAIRAKGGEPLVDHKKIKNVRRYLARKGF